MVVGSLFPVSLIFCVCVCVLSPCVSFILEWFGVTTTIPRSRLSAVTVFSFLPVFVHLENHKKIIIAKEIENSLIVFFIFPSNFGRRFQWRKN